MNTPLHSSTNTNIPDVGSLMQLKTNKKKSFSEILHNPRKFLGVVIGMVLVSVLGIGLVVAMQSMNQSTEDRSQAFVSGSHNMDMYFDPDNVTLPANTASPSATVPVKLVAGHTVGAVTFGISFPADMIDLPATQAITFLPNPQYSVISENDFPDVDGDQNTKEMIFMVYASDRNKIGVVGGEIGALKVIPKVGFAGTSTISFLKPTPSQANAIGVAFAPATYPGLGEVIIFDAASGSSGQYAGMIFNVNPRNSLRVTSATLPAYDPSIQFPGEPPLGRLFYCSQESCTDTSGWTEVTLQAGQTEALVPNSAKKLLYEMNTFSVPTGWSRNTRADFSDGTVLVKSGMSQVETQVLTDVKWPVKVGANFNKIAGDLQYQCTVRTSSSLPSKKEFSYMRVGQPEGQQVIGTCTNNTVIVVNKQGDTLTPTAVPPTPTTWPLTPTVEPTLLQCRTTPPKLNSPLAIRPAVVAIDGGSQFTLQWQNVLQNAPAGGGKYGVYLVDDGTQATPDSGQAFYLYDLVDGNTNFTTAQSSGALLDASLNLSPGTATTTSFTWTVPTDDRVDKLGQAVRTRPFYRFLVYARLNDGAASCSNQAVIGRWSRN